MNKLFTIAGTSVLNNVNTFRFATGEVAKRLWVLTHNGHTDIALHELPHAMTKEDAIVFLQSNGMAGVNTVLPNAKKVIVEASPAKKVGEVHTVGDIDWEALSVRWDALETEHNAAVLVLEEAANTNEAPKKQTFGEKMAALRAAKKAA